MLKPPYNYKGVPILPNSKSAYRPYRKGISPGWKFLVLLIAGALVVSAVLWELVKKNPPADTGSAAPGTTENGEEFGTPEPSAVEPISENVADGPSIRVVPPAGDNPTPEESAMLGKLKGEIAKGNAEKVRKGLEKRLLKMEPGDRLFSPFQAMLSQASDELLKRGDFLSAHTQYTVKRGDNLSIIALRHNVPVQQIRESNQLTSDRLQIGQQLRIPGNAWELTIQTAKQLLLVSENGRLVKIYSLRVARIPNLRTDGKFILRAQNEEWNLYGLDKKDIADLKRFVPLGSAVTITK